jgi:glycerol-3-phosphate dehydrogenase (NAD(P)+)
VNVVVVGGGSWGTAFAWLLAEHGHETTLACRDPAQAEAITATGHNPRYLPLARLDRIVAATIADAPVADADLVVVAVPSSSFAEVVRALPGDCPVLSLTKGLDPHTSQRLSTLVEGRPVACLSGPNFAEEIAAGLPAATVIASEDEAKNVMALAAGGVDGLGLGDNAKAGVITRGVAEMARLGQASGARLETFAGLAGMGDLMVTCWSKLGRNRRAGELIARGRTAEEAVAEIGQVVEGINTAAPLRDLARRLSVDLPITEAVCSVLEGESLTELVGSIMGRTPRAE